jgi:hypothetical protein
MLPTLLGAVLLLATPSGPTCTAADERIERTIAAKRDELRGHEYCQYRIYDRLGDVDGDGVEDLLVVFTIEGVGGQGNSSSQFLAAFGSRSEWRPVVVEVGRRGQRVVQAIRVRAGLIDLSSLEYAPTDAMCCPSKASHVQMRLNAGKLAVATK